MIEFVGFRAMRMDGKKETKKTKGIKSNANDNDFTQCLNEKIEITRRQLCIRSKLHEVYTISELKIALNPYEDK